MGQNTLVNYSKNDIQDIIYKSLKNDKKLEELNALEINNVLEYIDKHKLNIKLFKCKYYDVLTKKFIAVEYKMGSRFANLEESIFDTFNEFYSYINGDVYEKTCLYGYEFTKEKIEEFNLNLKNINFISFTTDTIDNYSFDALKTLEEEKNNVKKQTIIKLNDWFSKNGKVTTLKELKLSHFNFYCDFVEGNNSSYLNNMFFSVIQRTNKNVIKDALVEYYCSCNCIQGLSFDDIIIGYGVDVARETIGLMEKQDGIFTKSQIQNRKKRLRIFAEEKLNFERKIFFDESRYLYIVEDKYFKYGTRPFEKKDYFLHFEELVDFLNGDLSGADLSKAPIDKNSILNFKINETTILPLPKEYNRYIIEKSFINSKLLYRGSFVVKQSWYSNDILIREDSHNFTYFFDFVYFLKGDLSNADLISCEGLENVDFKKLKTDNIKVTSKVLSSQENDKNEISLKFDDFELELSKENELNTNKSSIKSINENYYNNRVSYITDIHLPHKLKCNNCKSKEDITSTIRKLVAELSKTSNDINLIGGDISNDIGLYESFLNELYLYNKNNLKHFSYFITLGNHELWQFKDLSLQEIINKYKYVLDRINSSCFHLVHNNLFYYDCGWKEISQSDLKNLNIDELQIMTKTAKMIIFGGLGFAGENQKFNADNGLYQGTISRAQEIEESRKFKILYDKVTSALNDKNLIILTHMPLQDWAGEDAKTIDEVVYVSGHTHRNYYYDDGKKRVFEDNQVGYLGKDVHFKSFSINFDYDLFKECDDGIHEITKEDYHNFYRGINQIVTFNRKFKKLYLLKRKGNYMFLMLGISGNLSILNGGQIRVCNNDVNYYYDKLDKYVESVNMFLAKYNEYQREISNEMQKIGGDGKIHGAIIDIDYNNHIYVNPLDGTLTAYSAFSMIDKYIYKNIPSLLKYECPALFNNYKKVLEDTNTNNNLTLYDSNLKLSKSCKFNSDTTIYRYSRIIKGLQYTTNNHVVRLWADDLVDEATEENGKMIVTKLLLASEV